MTELLTNDQYSMKRYPSGTRTEWRPAAAGVGMLLLLLAAAALWDPSGLLAPAGGRGLALVGFHGTYQWASGLVGLPLLIMGVGGSIVATVRAGRPGLSRRSVFLATWVSILGIASLVTAATGFLSVSGLIGPHLSLGEAVRFALVTGGFAAVKFVLVGPLVAGAAAAAHRRDAVGASDESRPVVAGTATGTAMSIATMAAVVSLAAIWPGSTWWRGGPVGYAFFGPLLAPTTAAGYPGFLAGFILFLGVCSVGVRAALRRVSAGSSALALAGSTWFGAITGGLAIGFVNAAIEGFTGTSPSGPDNWWIATILISVAVAIAYGATIGAVTALICALIAARSPRVFVRRRGVELRWPVAVPTVALALPLLLMINTAGMPEPPRRDPVAANSAMQRLELLPAVAGAPSSLPTIGDAAGRQVLLRGVNVNQLIDYYLRDPAIPANGPLTDEDFAGMASMGFNVVRLGMSWSRLEPERGVFDQAYLNGIVAAVAEAKTHGLYTVLDMHQDAWGNTLASPGQACGGGTTATTGWDGAPGWATITDGALHCQFMARDLAPAVAEAFSNFYTNRDGIQNELVRTWSFVATAFAGDPAVAGYDLLNEPGIGANPPTSSGLLLGRYYDAAITAIRAAEQSGHGFSHLVFFEPSVLWSGLGFDVVPPPGFTSDREIVFAPHPYSESITLDQSLGVTIASIERNLTMSARAAETYGAALWAGEWGWFGDPTVDGAKVARFTAEQDRLGIGGAFWVWRQGCGSPETGADATTSGNLVGVDCSTGASIDPPAGFAEPLTRAYPRVFPGRLDSLKSAANGRDLRFAATSSQVGVDCDLEIWVPGELAPQVTAKGVENVQTTAVPGGWTVSGCAHGAYSVLID